MLPKSTGATLASQALWQNPVPDPEHEVEKLGGLEDGLSFWFLASSLLAVCFFRRKPSRKTQIPFMSLDDQQAKIGET
jgi:hypothetical protein